MAGTLYLVGTPIGNLEDITFRAVRILRECDLIACEDTRQTRKLLNHYGIDRPVVSYHDHNEASRAAELAARLEAGVNVALVSDAGMPLVADPGYRLVQAALAVGAAVQAVPGASALITALAASGLPTDEFRFLGFLPPKHGQRRRRLESLRDDPTTLVFYEAPHRILETLADLAEVAPDRPVVVAREITKLHEEYLRGSASEILAILSSRPVVKGEITLLVGESKEPVADSSPVEEAVAAAEAAGMSHMDAVKTVARSRGLPKRAVYQQLLRK